ncbi:hypothetical protein B0T17DRAFT_506994 [Bombardia bombarda]|uniref:Protein kinase domain-containing protein n=1 Tax=Bombardia bombarda TaxID=252184 RepID=A0AA40C9Y3_9PEZI|nr:hypothetical protein B0T17DRAFT_506994 [Bombardia bombarda]
MTFKKHTACGQAYNSTGMVTAYAYNNKAFVPNTELDRIFNTRITKKLHNLDPNYRESKRVIAILLHRHRHDPDAFLMKVFQTRMVNKYLPMLFDKTSMKFKSSAGNRRIIESPSLVLSPTTSSLMLSSGSSYHLALVMRSIRRKTEQKALTKIQSLKHNHLIKVVASFKRGQDYFFLFPWAEGGDLRHFWKTPDSSPKSRASDMMLRALKQMKGLSGGIKLLHNPPSASGLKFEENGRHGDLQTENMLLFLDRANEPRGTLRITNVGLARFHMKITSE